MDGRLCRSGLDDSLPRTKRWRGTLSARLVLEQGTLDAIRAELEHARVNQDGVVCATVEKTIYMRRKDDMGGSEPSVAAAPSVSENRS